MLTFRNRLLILLIGLVLGAQIVTLVTTLARTSSTESARAAAQLTAGVQVARQLMTYREQQLANAVGVLSADYGLREAIASADKDTVASALANHATRVGADLTMALDLDGNLIASGEGATAADGDFIRTAYAVAERGTEHSQFVASHDVIYQVFAAPVRAPTDIAYVLLGFAVDAKLAKQFQKLIGVDVAFLVEKDAAAHLVATTLSGTALASSFSSSKIDLNPSKLMLANGEYLSAGTHINADNLALNVALLKSMYEVRAPFRQMAWNLGFIIGATLLAAAFVAFYLGRSAARPVLKLAEGADRIAAGDYSVPVKPAGGQELARLADAFNSMQIGIADRESQLLHLARHDMQTNLPNRLHAEEWLAEHLRNLKPNDPYYIVVVKLTNLQEIAASLGFSIGEQLVRHIGSRLKDLQPEGGLVARIDSASFVVVGPTAQVSGVDQFAETIHHCVQGQLRTAGISLQAAAALGISEIPQHSTEATEALRCAEAAAEAAIQSQKTTARFDSNSDQVRRRHLQLGADLPLAIKTGQLFLLYQPKVSATDRTLQGVEALVRWQHPVFGKISPLEFVQIAERTGASADMTRFVLSTALRDLGLWHKAGAHVGMAINLSATDLLDVQLLQHVLKLLHEAHIPPGALTLEITESVFIRDAEVVKQNIELLRVAGVRFSVDDFGTGYSSLSQLRQLAVDELKIDQSFIRGTEGESEATAVIRAIVELGHGLGLRVVAEGIETESQMQMVATLNCDYGQGYLISPPISAQELAPMLEEVAERERTQIGVRERTQSLRVLELRR
jgi:diguanylate cyclase (GGDEF)-like protein